MTYRLIRYRTRPEAADENQRLVESVFEELRARRPEGVHYATLRGADGAFFHLAALDSGQASSPLSTLSSFQEFQRGLRDRCEEPPQVVEVTLVGNHRMLPG